MNKYKNFINNIFENSPEFMIINENSENYLILDRLVNVLNDNAMTWLFKVYLEQQYNILHNDKFTLDMRAKYKDLNLQVIDFNGNLFFNLDGLCAIIMELESVNQIVYNEQELNFKLT